MIITKIEKIDNKLCTFNSYIPQNLIVNINSAYIMPCPKLIHFALSLLDVFSHFLSAILATNSALLGGGPVDLEIGRIHRLLISAKHFCQINNNFYIYYRSANHYI